MSYREFAPEADPYGLYACVWSRHAAGGEFLRVVPDACVDLIWHRESGELLVAGPDTTAHLTEAVAGTLIGLRFTPGSAPAGLGVPADALRDGRVALDTLWRPAAARRLADRLAAAGSDVDAQRVLEVAVATHTDGPRDEVATAALSLLRAASQDRQVGRISPIAEKIGLSERQLHRRCLTAFGYGPKVLHRVLRFDRAVRLARSGTALAEVAHRSGYADQAHLSREVKALAGVPLGTLVG